MKIKKFLLPVLTCGMCVCATLGFTRANMTKGDAATVYSIQETALQYIAAQDVWKTDEAGSGNIGKWTTHVVSPSATGAMSVIFTAPNDATLTNVSITAFDAYVAETDDDGCRFAIFRNNEKIYPSGDELYAALPNNGDATTSFMIESITLSQNDKLYFMFENGGNGNVNSDGVVFDVWCGYYQDTATEMASFNLTGAGYGNDTEAEMNASAGLGDYTKSQLISYAYVEVTENAEEPIAKELEVQSTALQYIAAQDVWKTAADGSGNIGKWTTHVISPSATGAMAVVFTAPNAATITNMSVTAFDAYVAETDDDGCRIAILKNNQKIYPSGEDIYATLPNSGAASTSFNIENIELAQGDKLYFIIENGGNGNNNSDGVVLDVWCGYYQDTVTEMASFNLTGAGYGNDTEAEMNAPAGLGDYTKAQLISYAYVEIFDGTEEEPDDSSSSEIPDDSSSSEIPDDSSSSEVPDDTPNDDIPEENIVDGEPDSTPFLVNATTLQYIESQDVWRTSETASGLVGKWGNYVVSPSTTGTMGLVFTAPVDATLSNVIITAFDAYVFDADDDGCRIAIFKNNQRLFPLGNAVYAEVSNDSSAPTKIKIDNITLKAGDKVYFVIENGGNGKADYDGVVLDVSCAYKDAVLNVPAFHFVDAGYGNDSEMEMNAPAGLGDYTKAQLISYAAVTVLESADMSVEENLTDVSLINKKDLHWGMIGEYGPYWIYEKGGAPFYESAGGIERLTPGNDAAIAVEFTAPRDGTISNAFGLGSFKAQNTSDLSDGSRITIVKNGRVIYPSTGIWASVPYSNEEAKNIEFNSFEVKAGDKLYYIVDNGGMGSNNFDNVFLSNLGFMWIDSENPSGVYFSVSENFYDGNSLDAESAIKGFKKSELLKYVSISSVEGPMPEAQDIEKTEVEPYDESLKQNVRFDSNHEKMMIGGDLVFRIDQWVVNPTETYMLALEWTAPEKGRVNLSNSLLYNVGFNPNDLENANGVKFKILYNQKFKIYPAGAMEWEYTTASDITMISLPVFAVEKGDTITIVLDCNGNEYYDSIVLKMIVDFAKDGSNIPERYDSYAATQKAFETEDGTLEGTAWKYYGIEYETWSDRYFGGNTYEPPVLTMNVESKKGCGSIVAGSSALVLALGALTPIALIKKRRRTK